jgi:hypothetical protein
MRKINENCKWILPSWIGRAAAVASILLPVVVLGYAQIGHDSDDEAINYLKSPSNDPISKLQRDVESGAVKLKYDPKHGYLPSVLKSLGIPISSQVLVFSKTSFQHTHISPQNPRALYFNDHTYIGWVQGGDYLEISTTDPQLGGVFYLLPQVPDAKPKFKRQTFECLQCHDGSMTRGVPGHIMRSVYARVDGQPDFRAGSYLTSDQSQMEERWGGWYVTGTHGGQRHMGNMFTRNAEHPDEVDRDSGANVTSLKRYFDTTPYLAPGSDIVALMILEHETNIHNLTTRANYQTRIALNYERQLNKELGRGENYRAESTMSRIRSVCDPLIAAILFSKEAPLAGPIKGTTTFATQFTAKGLRDKTGRSLRDLDLGTRLFKYPCSFLIYSDSFNGLPPIAKDYIYTRILQILNGSDSKPEFDHLDAPTRKAILEILTATKPDFAAFAVSRKTQL